MPGEVWGLILAAGAGTRFGGKKQFRTVGGVTLVERVVTTAQRACDEVVLVVPLGHGWDGPPVAAVVAGGATRAASVRAGLGAVDAAADIVVVADAAHPLASRALFDAVIRAVKNGASGAAPALRLPEALKRVEDQRVVATLAREGLVQMQTPQAFRAAVLRAAHETDLETEEDSELLEKLGHNVVVVPGDPRNLHVTEARDVPLADALLAALRQADEIAHHSGCGNQRSSTAPGPSDAHRTSDSID